MTEDLEAGRNSSEEQSCINSTENRSSGPQSRLPKNPVFRAVTFTVVILVPMMITFVTVIHFVGVSSEIIGLTPEQPPGFGLQKILGGVDARQGEFPHQILLQYKGKPICGGSLLETDIVITSAHCFDNSEDPSRYTIVAGEYNLNENEGTEQTRNVRHIAMYDKYDGWQLFYDIALLRLSEDVTFNEYVQSIKISEDIVSPNDDGTVIGWGVQTENGGNLNKILQKVTVPILSNDDCRRIYGDETDDSNLCAGYPEGKMDACQADSGGPLLKWEESRFTLIGLVSWGIGCGRPGYPGVYANVPLFKNWIKDTITKLHED